MLFGTLGSPIDAQARKCRQQKIGIIKQVEPSRVAAFAGRVS